MKSRTDKADEIHDYYLKLEELLQESINEESEELRLKLQNKESELKIKNKELEKLKDINKKNKIYIGHSPVYKHLTKIGITNDLSID